MTDQNNAAQAAAKILTYLGFAQAMSVEPGADRRRDHIQSLIESARQPKLHAPDGGNAQTVAARDVLAERQRQISVEGWSAGKDDTYTDGQMAVAAGYYALASGYPHERDIGRGHLPVHWPWGAQWWKPRAARENLVRAGALILAEIERLDRAASQHQEG